MGGRQLGEGGNISWGWGEHQLGEGGRQLGRGDSHLYQSLVGLITSPQCMHISGTPKANQDTLGYPGP